jgi:hypothetical protein
VALSWCLFDFLLGTLVVVIHCLAWYVGYRVKSNFTCGGVGGGGGGEGWGGGGGDWQYYYLIRGISLTRGIYLWILIVLA